MNTEYLSDKLIEIINNEKIIIGNENSDLYKYEFKVLITNYKIRLKNKKNY